MVTAKLAARLAFSPDLRQRWRQVSVVAGSLLVTLLVLLSAGFIGAARHADEVIAARSPIWASLTGDDSVAADATLLMSVRGMDIDGFGQIPVQWIEPVAGHESDPGIVPPGLSRLPEPGEAVLSPGLTQAGWIAADFGFLPSTAGEGTGGAIGPAGTATTTEGWIYVRPAVGRTLGTGGALLQLRGYVGEGGRAPVETVPQLPSTGEAVLGVVWLLLLPGVFVAAGAARAMSDVRDERARTLWRLGISVTRVRGLLAVESGVLAVTGAAVAWALWQSVGQGVRRFPMTGITLVPDALHLPLALSLALTVVVPGIAVVAAVATRIPRPAVRRDLRRTRRWHVLPLLGAVVLMGSTVLVSQSSSTRLYLLFAGLLLTLATLPLALPALTARLGAAAGLSRRPAIWLAGRRMSLRSANLARPAVLVAALVFIAGAAFAMYGRMVVEETDHGEDSPLVSFVAGWRDNRPGDLDAVRTRLSNSDVDLVVLPVQQREDGSSTAAVIDCEQLTSAAAALRLDACAGDRSLNPDLVAAVAELTRVDLVLAGEQRAGGASSADGGTVLLLGDQAVTAQDVAEAIGPLPALNLAALSGVPRPGTNPIALWLVLGWITATAILSLGLLREVGDRALAALNDTTLLECAGLRTREATLTLRLTVLLPVLVAVPIGYVAAVCFAVMGYNAGWTVVNLARISLVAALATALALCTFVVVFTIHSHSARLLRR